jgi:hypothetical protein
VTTQVSENPEVQGQYATQVALTAALTAALARLWPQVDPLSGATALSGYKDGVAALVEQFSQASISLAADFYDAARDAAGVTGSFSVPIIDTPPRSLVDAGVDWAMRAQAEMDATEAAIMARVDAAMQKAITDAARDEVVAAVEGDDQALGFVRVARPDACYFCLAQAMRRKRPTDGEKVGRPGVYKSRGTAGGFANDDFTGSGIAKFHNNCHCVIEPVFSADYQLVPHVAAAEDLYYQATLHSKPGESLNDFRRALEAVRAGKPIPVLPSKVRPIKPQSPADAIRDLFDRLNRAS